MKPSPTPWSIEREPDGRPRRIIDADGEHVTYIDTSRLYDDSSEDPQAITNYELLIRAVNSHADLLAACKLADGALSMLVGQGVIVADTAFHTAIRDAIAKGTP